MTQSDSDSDDFFSDIKAFRRKLGLSKSPPAPTPDANTGAPGTPSGKRPATPVRSAARPRKRRSIESMPEQPQPRPKSATPAAVGAVSAGEIAALLSPRTGRQRQRKRPASDANASSIPARTPESRITSPHGRLFSTDASPVTTPTAGPHAGSLGQSERSRRNSGSPDSALFSMRSLWDRAASSPLITPVRGTRLAAPLLESPRTTSKSANRNSILAADRLRAQSPQACGGLLGRVEEALVTDADLDAAKRKLGQEQALTQQQIMREIRERIVGFAAAQHDDSVVEQCAHPATLLCQFYTFGHGALAYTRRGIVWQGELLGPIANVAQSIGAQATPFDGQPDAHTTLVFPWRRVSSLRVKCIDGGEFLMATVDADLGIAFRLSDADSVAGLADRMNAQLQEALADHQPQSGGQEGSSEPGAAVDRARELIRGLLGLAADQSGVISAPEIERALGNPGFVEEAASSIAALGRQLAEDAQAALRLPAAAAAQARPEDSAALPSLCTLCYARDEAIELAPCSHRMCSECLAHLQRDYPSSSQAQANDPSVSCTCPWDRCPISTWTEIQPN
ncbi:hypothetical protein IWW55_001936 [Coemansia sp. RSA 2706]|nr:hypothetical protein IWW55_001936 [Coemansia sp. RSA 2706]KAJ2370568.1 hypothetical protein H4S01_000270 [Coemansia sp. RSA 2610]